MVIAGSNSRSAPAAVVLPVFAMSLWEYVRPGPVQPAPGIALPVWLTQSARVAATGGPPRDGACPVDAQPTIKHVAPSAIHWVM
jgi:hypothetical protein